MKFASNCSIIQLDFGANDFERTTVVLFFFLCHAIDLDRHYRRVIENSSEARFKSWPYMLSGKAHVLI